MKKLKRESTTKEESSSKRAAVQDKAALKINEFSKLVNENDGKREGSNLWKDIYEKGFSYLKIGDFRPIYFQNIADEIDDNHRNTFPRIGLKEARGLKVYYRREGHESCNALPKFPNSSVEAQLAFHYQKLFEVGFEILRLLAQGGPFHDGTVECLEQEIKQKELALLRIGPTVMKKDTLSESESALILKLFKEIEKKKQLISLAKSNDPLFGTEPHKILFDYPCGPEETGPDYLTLAEYFNTSLEEHFANNLFSIIFCQKWNDGGLEVKTPDGEWEKIHEDICSQSGLCVLIPGHQLQLLTHGLFRATAQRVVNGTGGLSLFSLQASGSKQIDGRRVAAINEEWEKLNPPPKISTLDPKYQDSIEVSGSETVSESDKESDDVHFESSLISTSELKCNSKKKACSGFEDHVHGKVPSKLWKSCVVCVDKKIGTKGTLRKGTNTYYLNYKKYTKGCKTCEVIICPNHWDLYHTNYRHRGIRIHSDFWEEEAPPTTHFPERGSTHHVHGSVSSRKFSKSCVVCVDLKQGTRGTKRKGCDRYYFNYKKYSKGCKTCSVVICPEHWDLYHTKYMGRGIKLDASSWRNESNNTNELLSAATNAKKDISKGI